MSRKLQKYILVLIFALLGFFSLKAGNVIHINVNSISFIPTSVNAAVGDTIRWIFLASNHNTTSISPLPAGATSWASGTISVGDSFQYVITEPGTYNYECTIHGFNGTINAVSTELIAIDKSAYNILIFPNPAPEKCTIEYNLPKNSPVKIELFDVLGKQVVLLLSENQSLGKHSSQIDLNQISRPGLYFVKTTIGEKLEVRKLRVE